MKNKCAASSGIDAHGKAIKARSSSDVLRCCMKFACLLTEQSLHCIIAVPHFALRKNPYLPNAECRLPIALLRRGSPILDLRQQALDLVFALKGGEAVFDRLAGQLLVRFVDGFHTHNFLLHAVKGLTVLAIAGR